MLQLHRRLGYVRRTWTPTTTSTCTIASEAKLRTIFFAVLIFNVKANGKARRRREVQTTARELANKFRRVAHNIVVMDSVYTCRLEETRTLGTSGTTKPIVDASTDVT